MAQVRLFPCRTSLIVRHTSHIGHLDTGYDVEKKKERRRMKVDNVIPDGEDDGTAGKKMILAMVDEVLEKRALAAQLSTGVYV